MKNKKRDKLILQGRGVLLYIDHMNDGDAHKCYDDITNHTYYSVDDIENYSKKHKGDYLTVIDNNYPRQLFMLLKNPPIVIHYSGDIKLLDINYPKYLVVGRNTTNIPAENIMRIDFKKLRIHIGNKLTLWITSNSLRPLITIAHTISSFSIITECLTVDKAKDSNNPAMQFLKICEKSDKPLFTCYYKNSLNSTLIKNNVCHLYDDFWDFSTSYKELKITEKDLEEYEEEDKSEYEKPSKKEEMDFINKLMDAISEGRVEIKGYKISADDIKNIFKDNSEESEEESPEIVI